MGEITKLRKHVEWSLDANMKDTLKANQKGREERDQTQRELLEQLFEAMDKLQENMQKIAVRIEKSPVSRGEEDTGFDPPQAPTGQLGSPMVTPMTPGHGLMFGSGIPPPPTVPAGSGAPSAHVAPPKPPSLPLVKFVGYSPARIGELPMSHALHMEVKDLKQPCQMLDESTGRIRAVSPTARHDPATGTAAFSPLGYVQVKGTNEYRLVYP